MFLDELAPIAQQLMQQPISFLGGLSSGLFRLNLSENPIRSWLDQQTSTTSSWATEDSQNGKSGGPQSISID